MCSSLGKAAPVVLRAIAISSFPRWVIHADHKHETIQLRLRQRIGPFLLNGVLRGQHEEWRIQDVGAPRHRDAVLLHGFEHGGLRLRGRPIDFIRQNDVREHGAFGELEGPLAAGQFLQDVGAGDVHRHQIGGKLNATEAQRHGLRQPADEECLGQPWDAHEQRVPPGEQTDDQLLDHLMLADDDFPQFVRQTGVDLTH